mmetsp:Transcript_95750/g.166350  ORF Transcript_95750/g.166350 Transcript_95750/m.166350 type:complete len:330 (+) Transcript_95750:126-1115(+)
MPAAIDLPATVGIHEVRADDACALPCSSMLWSGSRHSTLHARRHSSATSFFTECNFDAMGSEEIRYWWPGKAGKGECNDLTDRNRGCWYPGKIVPQGAEGNTCKEDEKGPRCIQIKSLDGETSHSFTCPSWIRKIDPEDSKVDGERCHGPEGTPWNACPLKFAVRRQKKDDPNGGPFWRFKGATWTECHGADHDCHGYFNPHKDQEELKVAGYYLDIGKNEWWKCTPWLKCEKVEGVTDIGMADDADSKCKDCKEGDQCFEIQKFGSKEPKYECVPSWKVNVVSKSVPASALAAAICLPKLPGRVGRRLMTRPRSLSGRAPAHALGLFL